MPQGRVDGACTTLKFQAWRLLDFTGVLVVDTDVCMHEDVLPFFHEMERSGRYFAASGIEVADRAYDGLNTHMIYLVPNQLTFQLLTDKARLADFLPYTNTEQDILETVFPVHLPKVRFPKHDHKKFYRACEKKCMRKSG